MKQYYLGAGWGEMFSSFITTPAILIDYDETEYKVEFYSGFFQPHFTDSNEICMNIGYIIREDQQVKKNKLKRMYQTKGVNITDKGRLEIPKCLQKNINEILSVFDSCFYNYYGIDPEEEARKEFYLNEGVKEIETKNTNTYTYKYKKYVIPSKFKDNQEALEEIKELFHINVVKFYDL